MTKADFINKAYPAAIASGHIFPEYAVAESALESAWGQSVLAREASNLFGEKRGCTTINHETIEIPTQEYMQGQWIWVKAEWPKFADWEESFRARMMLLNRLPCYAAALAASTGESFVKLVSVHWATDPHRADKVLETYRCNLGLLANAKTMAGAVKKAAV
jgi:flagellum-specific peptidoglycan hydrolase FlgJ